ncbi:MAG: hypothetical protein AB1763_08730 [Campylobacterota bacterium]
MFFLNPFEIYRNHKRYLLFKSIAQEEFDSLFFRHVHVSKLLSESYIDKEQNLRRVAAYSLGMEIIKHFFYVLGEPSIFRSMNRRIKRRRIK